MEKVRERMVRPALIEVEVDVEGEVLICDPCYYTEDGTNDPGSLGYKFDGTGTWTITTELSDEGAWGLRVKELCGTRRGTLNSHGPELLVHDDLGVDAGLMAFIPVASGPVKDWSKFCDEIFGRGFDDNSRRGAPMEAQGRVISSSGYGDGTYQLYVRKDDDGKIAEFRIDFFGQMFEEEEREREQEELDREHEEEREREEAAEEEERLLEEAEDETAA